MLNNLRWYSLICGLFFGLTTFLAVPELVDAAPRRKKARSKKKKRSKRRRRRSRRWYGGCGRTKGQLRAFCKKAESQKDSFVCKGNTKASTDNVTCKQQLADDLQQSWRFEKCKAGAIIWQPTCALSCFRKYQCTTGRCYVQKACDWRSCSPEAASCRGQLYQKQRACDARIGARRAACRRRKHRGVLNCRTSYHQLHQACKIKRAGKRPLCQKAYKDRLAMCHRYQKGGNSAAVRRCQLGFRRCMDNRSVGAIGSLRCGDHWPCQKNCYAERGRCMKMHHSEIGRCFNTAERLRTECAIKWDKVQTICIQTAVRTLYACTEPYAKELVRCMNQKNNVWRSCNRGAVAENVTCWVTAMDKSSECARDRYDKCEEGLVDKYKECLDACPKCEIKPPPKKKGAKKKAEAAKSTEDEKESAPAEE